MQPLDELVTVSVYFPALLTVGFCKVEIKLLGPLQLLVTPDVDELPARVTEVLAQVIVPPDAVAPGKIISCETIAVSVDIQPLTGLVTVKV